MDSLKLRLCGAIEIRLLLPRDAMRKRGIRRCLSVYYNQTAKDQSINQSVNQLVYSFKEQDKKASRALTIAEST